MNWGGRFSRNDITPSRTSAERPSSLIALESTRWASIGRGAPSIRQSICRVMDTDTAEVVDAISAAIS